MRTLSDIATTLFLAIAARHVKGHATLADAAALIAGRTQKWSTWHTLSMVEQTTIAVGLRLRPGSLAQPANFVDMADTVLKAELSPFELVDPDRVFFKLEESDQFRIRAGLNLDQVLQENLEALKHWQQPPTITPLPASGPIVLKAITADRTRIFTIPEAERGRIPPPSQRMAVKPAPAVSDVTWDYAALAALARQLDGVKQLHDQHFASLSNIWTGAGIRSAQSGHFYRVNAATGTGKTVVKIMMAIDAALRGHKVVIAVPGYVELDNTIKMLKQASAVAAPHLKVAPLHSLTRMQERLKIQFEQFNGDHPYDYSCLLNAYASELQPMPAKEEPCFRLQVVTQTTASGETTKQLQHCPFLFACGRTRMLAEALQADIVVINHHALLSGTTRIPLEDSDQFPGPRSFIELLLRTSPIFLVDEIDGLLKTAIDNSAFSLQLGNIGDDSPLIGLFRTVINRTKIPGIDQSSLIRMRMALAYCCVSVDQLMNLQQRRYFEWPKKETTWVEADDGFITRVLGIDVETLRSLYRSDTDTVPAHLRNLRNNLVYWRTNDPADRPENKATELGGIINTLSVAKQLKSPLNPKDQARLKAGLILRGVLDFIEIALRNLQIELPGFVNAQVPFAQEVQSELQGREPLSFSPIGPLHRTVFGFKRKQTSTNESTLNIVAMRGDPHGTLLALPDVAALGYAGVKRLFIGFSATAYFPGASAFDLKARDFIDVPDAKGQVSFEDVGLTTKVSGAPYFERKERIRQLAVEIWPWLEQRLEKLAKDPETEERARLLLVASSDADAELLAITLADLAKTPTVGWVRGRASEYKPTLLNADHALVYDDLAQFIKGKHRDKTILVSALHPMARGHNIVNKDGLSAIGGVVICVRPLPASDSPENNLAHICYETWNSVFPQSRPGDILRLERGFANQLLNSIRKSPPAFSQQPANIRHYTVMNILVVLTQLIGRGRRGGTPVTCYFADAAFTEGRPSWAKLLASSIERLKDEGAWDQFALHHNGIASAVAQYIARSETQTTDIAYSAKEVR